MGNKNSRGFKYYGPEKSGLRPKLRFAGSDTMDNQEDDNPEEAVAVDGTAGPVSEETEIWDPPRPKIPNSLVMLPLYHKKELLDILCTVVPREEEKLREVFQVAEIAKKTTVVNFIEQIALALHDLDQEEEVVKGLNSVEFWVEFEERLQRIALKRLKPRRFMPMLYDSGSAPFSNENDEVKDVEVNGNIETTISRGEAGKNETPDAGDSREGLEADETFPPKLRLEIPEQQPTFTF